MSDNLSIRDRLNDLTLNDRQWGVNPEDTSSHRSSQKYKKRRYRELDSCWSINDSKGQDTLRATHNTTPEGQHTSSKSGNKRELKLEKKLISKLCVEVDHAKSQGRQLSMQSGYR